MAVNNIYLFIPELRILSVPIFLAVHRLKIFQEIETDSNSRPLSSLSTHKFIHL